MKIKLFFVLFILMTIVNCGGDSSSGANPETSNNPPPTTQIRTQVETTLLDDGSYLCLPAGSPPFSGVLYNHGGLGDQIGGDLEGTCIALAEAGYIAFSQKRRETLSLAGHLDDVMSGYTYLSTHNEIDSSRIAILGFSRGGLLSFQAALEIPQLRGLILMAPASGNGALELALEQTNLMQSPTLILVSENDLYQDDHVALAEMIYNVLINYDKDAELIIYPPYANDGHTLFFTVGNYWNDVLEFIDAHLNI